MYVCMYMSVDDFNEGVRARVYVFVVNERRGEARVMTKMKARVLREVSMCCACTVNLCVYWSSAMGDDSALLALSVALRVAECSRAGQTRRIDIPKPRNWSRHRHGAGHIVHAAGRRRVTHW